MQNICTYFFSLHIPLSFEEFDMVAQVLRTFFLTRLIYNSNWFFLVHILVTIIRLKSIFLSSIHSLVTELRLGHTILIQHGLPCQCKLLP
jgi:hypothetical protein